MQNSKNRYILIDVVPPITSKEEAQDNLTEILSLIETFGGGEVVEIIQRRAHPHPGTYIGSGKAEEVALMVKDLKIDVVILNAIAKTTQLYKLERMFWKYNPNIKVWDRVDLILHIFSKHAKTAESKLQIELAAMKHMGPRMYGLSSELGRQAGGIGGRGVGETNVELMKRHWRDAIKKTSDKLKALEKNREKQLKRRREVGLKTVSIVGYTNAGKTTLFNKLTKKDKLAKDVLFATLDSNVGKMYFHNTQREILVSDTIGFIQNLPAELVEAFKSTLMESINADLLMHVIDTTDPKMYQKIHVVEEILNDLGLEVKRTMYVFNKTENIQQQVLDYLKEHFANKYPQFISAREGKQIEELKAAMHEIV
jgi:GTP-binding protein HflX